VPQLLLNRQLAKVSKPSPSSPSLLALNRYVLPLNVMDRLHAVSFWPRVNILCIMYNCGSSKVPNIKLAVVSEYVHVESLGLC